MREFREETGLTGAGGPLPAPARVQQQPLQALELFFEVLADDAAGTAPAGPRPRTHPRGPAPYRAAWLTPRQLRQLPPAQVHPVLRHVLSPDEFLCRRCILPEPRPGCSRSSSLPFSCTNGVCCTSWHGVIFSPGHSAGFSFDSCLLLRSSASALRRMRQRLCCACATKRSTRPTPAAYNLYLLAGPRPPVPGRGRCGAPQICGAGRVPAAGRRRARPGRHSTIS